jgi:hypothetical protein
VITSLSLNETLPGTSVVTNGGEAYLVHAVRQWTYRLYRLNGESTDVETTITVNFNLNP